MVRQALASPENSRPAPLWLPEYSPLWDLAARPTRQRNWEPLALQPGAWLSGRVLGPRTRGSTARLTPLTSQRRDRAAPHLRSSSPQIAYWQCTVCTYKTSQHLLPGC